MPQASLIDIGEPLSATTFVIVDLETTGASPRGSAITEIGAVKTRGGEVIGEFQTLVDPGSPIPPMIVALTGITDAMVHAAPKIEAVLPQFLEFLGDAVLVAHNAPFDVGFLRAACREHGYRWPGNQVVDTVILARRATTKEEAPNKKLSTLARLFSTSTEPNHRALSDARATADVLHAMLERLARFGITHREDLESLRQTIPEDLRKKATMADSVPSAPGVYVFRGPRGEHLYVGTSRNLRSRVKSYFTKAEQRRSMRDMLTLAVGVDTYVVPTALEAQVLEVRLINQHRPRYNRRSARPERTVWLRLTQERFPRLSVSRTSGLLPGAIGPMRGAHEASLAAEALQSALHVRTCTARLPIKPSTDARACLLADMGQCNAPCVRGVESGYDETATRLELALERDPSAVVAALEHQIIELSDRLEYERAARMRDGLAALINGGMRTQRLHALTRCRLIAARHVPGGWELASVVEGVLAGSARTESGVWAHARRLQDAWDELDLGMEALVEERELVLAWLDLPGTRLLVVDGEWSSPIDGAGRHQQWVHARRGDHEQLAQVMRGDGAPGLAWAR